MVRAERPQQDAVHTGFPADGIHDIAALGHRTLSHNLTSGKKFRPDLFHVGSGHSEQGNLAVHAGIHHLAKAVRRPAVHQIHDGLRRVSDDHVDTVEAFPALSGMERTEKGRHKMQTAHGKPLLHKHAGGEYAVESN